MYKDIFESIRNEAEKRNLRERDVYKRQHVIKKEECIVRYTQQIEIFYFKILRM